MAPLRSCWEWRDSWGPGFTILNHLNKRGNTAAHSHGSTLAGLTQRPCVRAAAWRRGSHSHKQADERCISWWSHSTRNETYEVSANHLDRKKWYIKKWYTNSLNLSGDKKKQQRLCDRYKHIMQNFFLVISKLTHTRSSSWRPEHETRASLSPIFGLICWDFHPSPRQAHHRLASMNK